MLSCLCDTKSGLQTVTAIISDICNGALPPAARDMLLRSRLIGIPKPAGGIRPISIGEIMYRLACSYVIGLLGDDILRSFRNIQKESVRMVALIEPFTMLKWPWISNVITIPFFSLLTSPMRSTRSIDIPSLTLYTPLHIQPLCGASLIGRIPHLQNCAYTTRMELNRPPYSHRRASNKATPFPPSCLPTLFNASMKLPLQISRELLQWPTLMTCSLLVIRTQFLLPTTD